MAENVQLELLRSASVEQRVRATRSLSSAAIQMARNAIKRAHPEFAENEISFRLLELQYGTDLAAQVRAYIHRKAT